MASTLQRKFVKPTSISNSLKCIICAEVFTQPTRLFCTHTFCYQCVQRFKQTKNTCPICRIFIDKKNIGPDLIAQSIIDELEVYCPAEDCLWTGLNCQLEIHYNFECKQKDKKPKSHMKNKVFNLELLKDEDVEQKINQNVTKGSLEARLQAAMLRNNPQLNTYHLPREQEKKEKRTKKEQEKKIASNSDFLESLFQ